MLHTLIGYSDQPSVLQVVVYAITLATILALTRWIAAPAAAHGSARAASGGAKA